MGILIFHFVFLRFAIRFFCYDRTNYFLLICSIMRIPRIYHPTSLNSLTSCTLSEDGANHVGRVLRMQPGDQT